MKAKIFSFEKLIGITTLRIDDESMGHLYGEFLPTANYYKYVQPSIWAFTSSVNPDTQLLQSLKLNLRLHNKYFVHAMGGVTIDDFEEWPDEQKQINIAGVDRHVIEDFFLQEEPRPFVVEPWETISIRQKFAFENELYLELGKDQSGLSSDYNSHYLSFFEAEALCHAGHNDDVLFRINNRAINYTFAVVSLTWRGVTEAEGYPKFKLYESFDEFKYKRMYPDKADWEY